MKLEYFQAAQGNFGDDLNEWLWTSLYQDLFDDDGTTAFLGVGTIIGRPLAAEVQHVIVFSSGIGYRPPPAPVGPRHSYVAVRGPLTARALDLPAHKAVGDGALLLATLDDFSPIPEEERTGIVLVPHFERMEDVGFIAAVYDAGVDLLDPRMDSRHVIQTIRRSKKVLADSMHAAIVADVLSVPWVPLASSNSISSFKWLDWLASLQMPYDPLVLPASSFAGRLQESLRSRVERPLFAGVDQESALENYRAMARERTDPKAMARRYRASYKVERLNGVVTQALDILRIGDTLNARQHDKLVRQISLASQRAGYLSDASTRGQIRDKLSYLLGEVVRHPERVNNHWPRL